MSLWRTSYVTILGLAYQSYRFEVTTERHLLNMANAARKAATLESEFQTDSALATENSDLSAADKLESESMQERAIALEEESERDAAAAEAASASGTEFVSKGIEEESQAEVHEATAVTEEAVYEADTEKALAEAAEAVALEVGTETDAAAVGTCEFIPGLNLFCDVIGGVAALDMQTSAARWVAKSAFDTSAAAAVKEQENANLVTSAALHVQAGENSEVAMDLKSKATEDQARSQEEAAAAKKAEMQADEKIAESEKEKALAEEEEIKADSEQIESSRWWEKSLVHGLAAFWTSVLSGFMSLMSCLFFFVRVVVAVLVPSVAEMTYYLPLITTLPSGTGSQESDERVASAIAILPKLSYFFLHCGVFFTGIITFLTKFELMDKFDTRSKGGVILIFAMFVASVQSLLLHVLPQHRIIRRQAGSFTMFCLHTMCRASCVFLCAIAYLVPLIIMETLSLWVIFGHDIFSPNLSQNTLPLFILGLLLSVLVHIRLFEREDAYTENNSSMKSDSSMDSSKAIGSERDLLLDVELTAGEEEQLNVPSIDYQSVVYNSSVEGGLPSEAAVERQAALGQANTGAGFKQNNDTIVAIDSNATFKEFFARAKQYFSVLHFPFEVLVICCMFTLVKSSIPTLKRLWPIFCKEFIDSHPKWVIILIGASISIVIAAFCWCLHRSSKNKPSTMHAGLFTGETIRTSVHTILCNR